MPLQDDSPEKWEYREHTKVKHEILNKYLECWIRILGKFHNLNILDCFAGRGRYADNSIGSPIIILRKLAEIHEKMNCPNEASCIFIEKNQNNFNNLIDTIEEEKRQNPDKYGGWLEIELNNDEFANVAKTVLEEYGDGLAPSFFFIDPFGYGGIPIKVIGDILSLDRTEAIITFMVRDVIRFLRASQHRISIETLYGAENIPRLLSEKYASLPAEQALLNLYLDKLRHEASINFAFAFKVNADDKLQTTYYLIHCTNHPKGCEVMKEIMFKTGTAGEFGYLGPAEGQLTISQASNFDELKDFLLERFRGKTLTFQQIRYATILETPCITKQYRDAIKELETEGKVVIEGKGKRGGVPDPSIVTFL